MLNRTKEALDNFKNYVIQQARTNLTKGKKNVDKKLYNSLQGFLDESPAGFRLYFEMEDYGMFQDKGVSGKKKKYDTPFNYTNKKPPIGPLARWAKKKNIRLRDEQGRFKKGSYNTIGFLISRSIFEKGIKPSLFFTKPFERAIKRLPEDLAAAFGDDIKNML